MSETKELALKLSIYAVYVIAFVSIASAGASITAAGAPGVALFLCIALVWSLERTMEVLAKEAFSNGTTEED